MKHYEAAELVMLGSATELVLGGWAEPPDSPDDMSKRIPGFEDDVD